MMSPLIPYEFDAERFSRWMAYVLRHNPTRYGLQPDQYGYVDLEEFFAIARRRYPSVTTERLRDLIESGGSGRFEISGDRLRARYGHSIAVEPAGPPTDPPERLYHGAESARIGVIQAEGLRPMDRRMLHLSETIDDALAVARRRTDQPVVFRVAARQAARAGLMFYREGRVYLSREIPPQFLTVEPVPAISTAAGADAQPPAAP